MPPSDDQNQPVIGFLNISIKQITDSLESLRRTVEDDRNRIYLSEEKIKRVTEDQLEIKAELRARSDDLQKRIDSLEKNIIEDQKKSSNRIIAIQATLLFLFAGSLIAYVFVFLPHPH